MSNWFKDFFIPRSVPASITSLDVSKSSEHRSVAGTTYAAMKFEELLTSVGLSGLYAKATPKSVMGIATFFGFARLISNVIASLPYSVYLSLEGGGSERNTDHELDYLIHTRFNQNMSSFIARRTLVLNTIVYGWAIAEIERDGYRNVTSITPYPTSEVTLLFDEQTDRYFFYIVKKRKRLSQDDVIFLRDLSFDGNTGVSLVNWQNQVLNIDLLAKAFVQKFYQDGTFMAGFFSTPLGYGAKDEEASKVFKKRLIDSFNGKDSGEFAFAVLGDGVQWHEIGKSPVDAQLMPLFEKSDRDIAKMFGAPLSMIGDSEKSTSFGTGIEQQYIGVTNNVFVPIAIQIEQEVDYKCFRKDEVVSGFYTKHNFKGLLRGDLKTQAEYNTKMVFAGLNTPDEIRALDEKPPYKKGVGARPYMQGAMIPMEKMDERIPKNQGNGNRKKDPSSTTE